MRTSRCSTSAMLGASPSDRTTTQLLSTFNTRPRFLRSPRLCVSAPNAVRFIRHRRRRCASSISITMAGLMARTSKRSLSLGRMVIQARTSTMMARLLGPMLKRSLRFGNSAVSDYRFSVEPVIPTRLSLNGSDRTIENPRAPIALPLLPSCPPANPPAAQASAPRPKGHDPCPG
mgnify:CR=1 FL=1